MKTPEGTCKYCKKNVAGSAMQRHLSSCESRKNENTRENGGEKIFLICAKSGPFWIYFEANASDTLEEIDSFLRNLWLECCGHLSAFKVNGVNYNSSPDAEYNDKSMNTTIGKVLKGGTRFSHEYDFGTTTELDLKCLSERTGNKLKDIQILARNNPPDFRCAECGKPAEEICTECLWEKGEGAFLCKKCAEEHGCDEEMLLPVVNSPRMGMCGYTG